jgi:hypothetical protein
LRFQVPLGSRHLQIAQLEKVNGPASNRRTIAKSLVQGSQEFECVKRVPAKFVGSGAYSDGISRVESQQRQGDVG